jgi:prevent-host-death family protein
VLRPIGEHGRSDLAFEIGDRLWRVQCKWGRLDRGGDVIKVRTGGSRCTPKSYVRTTYSERDVDLFGVYCGELDRCFLLPIELVAYRPEISLRLRPARNSQQACINLADDFDFVGAIAQLGERLSGTQEVAGSSPASSTSSPPLLTIGSEPHPGGSGPLTVGSNPFRDRLGYWMDRVAAGEEVVITRRGRPRIRLSPAT